MIGEIYLLNDNLVVLDKLANEADGAAINNATVTCTLKDSAGVNVAGQTWPLAMVYQVGSVGKYIGTLEDALSLADGAVFTAVIDADGGAGLKGHWEIPVKAKVRRS